jgi:hypothetical protein
VAHEVSGRQVHGRLLRVMAPVLLALPETKVRTIGSPASRRLKDFLSASGPFRRTAPERAPAYKSRSPLWCRSWSGRTPLIVVRNLNQGFAHVTALYPSADSEHLIGPVGGRLGTLAREDQLQRLFKRPHREVIGGIPLLGP